MCKLRGLRRVVTRHQRMTFNKRPNDPFIYDYDANLPAGAETATKSQQAEWLKSTRASIAEEIHNCKFSCMSDFGQDTEAKELFNRLINAANALD